MDNSYYVDGIEYNGKHVIRPLNEEEKEWLNKFNGEYYNASFDKNDDINLHKNIADDATIRNIRSSISKTRKMISKEQDSSILKDLYEELRDNIEYLKYVYPKKSCQDANNSRNRCLLNVGKATNEVEFIPWETLDQNTLGKIDIELMYIFNDITIDDEED